MKSETKELREHLQACIVTLKNNKIPCPRCSRPLHGVGKWVGHADDCTLYESMKERKPKAKSKRSVIDDPDQATGKSQGIFGKDKVARPPRKTRRASASVSSSRKAASKK